jgi:hypothetical protein
MTELTGWDALTVLWSDCNTDLKPEDFRKIIIEPPYFPMPEILRRQTMTTTERSQSQRDGGRLSAMSR